MHESASIMTSNDDWRAQAACRTEDPELFFPIVQAGPGLVQVARAKTVCARCEVRTECLRFAVETGQDHGVWGGTSEEERRALRRARIRWPAAPPQARTIAPGPAKSGSSAASRPAPAVQDD